MTKKAKLFLAGILLLVLATAASAYMVYYRCTSCGARISRSSTEPLVSGPCPNGGWHNWVRTNGPAQIN